MLAAGCSDMLKGTVKAMCSSGRSGSLVGEGSSAANAAIGAVGEITGWAFDSRGRVIEGSINDRVAGRAWSGEGKDVGEAATEAVRKALGDRRIGEYTGTRRYAGEQAKAGGDR